MKFSLALTAAALFASASAFTIKFDNKCSYAVWPAIGKAPNGQPDPSVAHGAKLAAGKSISWSVADTQIGIRAWGRTGCADNGTGCKTGGCNGGMVCTDGGITAGVILSEYGYADFGAQYGGKRISWDLSHVDSSINLATGLHASDGQSVRCASGNCPANQAYNSATDYAADRNSPLGATFTHTFCA
ncbi:Osmotin thaumatin-like protein [Coniophora puteana RWD-64-598 SS2]|uniref:Osmotin thaumatin-like protein n=1 Tax=Coniophora puteana (strain RWD-64-598) TaxID=741705 RepID=A0A5M3N2R5_CONPW|nr:Osmotin thaumatin-like protein [Coniophora puteana RWD-64-598 SS2]EIW85682.1 Osmotin thaumatin-like protein [Coniophora puteana RWD-64-598 SS2]